MDSVDLGSFDTRSERLTEYYRRLITDGTLQPGDKLPSAREMSERHSVGQTTAGRVLSALKSFGMVEFRPGVGTYVLGPRPDAAQGSPALEAAARRVISAYQAFLDTGDRDGLDDAIAGMKNALGG
jgi:DNA-binding FadR family transcriptional regulator